MFSNKKKEEHIEFLNQKIQVLTSQVEMEKKRNQDFQKMIWNSIPVPIPIWKIFLNFLISKEDMELSDQFTISEKEDKSFYSITYTLVNRRNNSYSKGRGGVGNLTDWREFRNEIQNITEFLDPELAIQVEKKRIELLKRNQDVISDSLEDNSSLSD